MVLLLGFITLIFVGCTKVSIVNNEYLIAGGKYFTHCIGVNSPGAIAGFEKMVSGLGVPVSVARTEGHVPSFMEKWVWCQVTRLEGDITEEVNGEAAAAAEPGPAEVADMKEERVNGHSKEEEKKEVSSEDEKGKKEDVKKQEKNEEEKKEEKKEVKKEEKKEDKKEEKKEEKKGGVKDLKDKLDSPKAKDKVLSKEKSNLDKKGKKAK